MPDSPISEPVLSASLFVKTKGGKRGPFSLKQLQRYVDAGTLHRKTAVGDGQGRWVAAEDVDGLRFSERGHDEPIEPTPPGNGHQSNGHTSNGQTVTTESDAVAAEVESKQRRLEQREDELTRLEQSLEQRRGEIEDRQQEVDAAMALIDQQRAAIESERASIESRRSDLEQREIDLRQLDDVQAEIEDREQKLIELTAQIERVKSELDGRIATVEEKEQAIEQVEQEWKAKYDEFQAWAGERENEIHQRVQALADRSEQLFARETELERHQQTLAERAAVVAESESGLREIEARLVEREAEIEQRAEQLPAVSERSESEHRTDSESESAVGTLNEIVEQKQELLREFAARQESLAQRESELIRRELELTTRELRLAATESEPIADDAVGADRRPETETPLSTTIDDADSKAEFFADDAEPKNGDVDPIGDATAVSVPGALESGETIGAVEEPDTEPEPETETRSTGESEDEFAERLGDESVDPSKPGPIEFTPDGRSAEWDDSDSVAPDEKSSVGLDETSGTPAIPFAAYRRGMLEQRFGPCDEVFHDDDPRMPIDVLAHPPSDSRQYMTLATSGMSDFPIPMPHGQRSVRAELLIYATHVDDAIVRIIRAAAKLPYQKKRGLAIGTTATPDLPGKLLSGSGQTGCVYMLPVMDGDSKPIPGKDYIDGSIQLFWLMMITDAERNLIESSGIHKFLGLFEKHKHSVYFDLTRECYVKRKKWFRR